MGSYYIPREYKGEGKILKIFSYKAFLFTLIGMALGFGFVKIFGKMLHLNFFWKLGIIGGLGVIFYSATTFKIPEIDRLEFTKKVGGDSVDDIIKRFIKFKMRKNRIYVIQKGDDK